ncbi:rifamycin-inactivating phosphotransferase [Listeria sp. ILCC792]|uniref:rifamycin-inactivating phosphotransferase n=1 Tax=Listeria sp. ILCC792 TaxID=1918331 RepID=UPI000B5961AC|nr:rifamycin-inactivating phosphotransferase [Listeria sp. ILCC792]
MRPFVYNLKEVSQKDIALVGGKAANLGELCRIQGVRVPEGFCISTEAFKKMMTTSSEIEQTLNQLASLEIGQQNAIRETGQELRNLMLNQAIPNEVANEIIAQLHSYEGDTAFAVRSSATAEDLPGTSFAGQQDTFLNITGEAAILEHVRKCWASLYNERAISYRMQNGFSQHVELAVVIQKLVPAEAAGVLFTADPLSGNRSVATIDASYGLGEGLVSGQVQADVYRIKQGKVTSQLVAQKEVAFFTQEEKGVRKVALSKREQDRPVLTETQIAELTELGKQIEQHFDYPVDIEWCRFDDQFFIVQSRRITTLFPLPKNPDETKRIYLSVGHQQMMTDSLLPLGMSVYVETSFGERFQAGGRLFVDVLPRLLAPESRYAILESFSSEPLTKDALQTILKRDNFVEINDEFDETKIDENKQKKLAAVPKTSELDPETVVKLVNASENALSKLKTEINKYSGADLIDFIQADIAKVKGFLAQKETMAAIMAAMDSAAWLNDKMNEWLGEENVADVLSQSLPDNITSEMGLALLDVADVIRPYPEIITFLEQVSTKNFLEELPRFKGGEEVRAALLDYLQVYGMRCVGEIDLTKLRWSEEPEILIPMILSNLKNFEKGARQEKYENGLKEVLNKKKSLLERLAKKPNGAEKVVETKKVIATLRTFSGFREYPKYVMVTHYFVYKQALLNEARKLVTEGIISQADDIYYVTLSELKKVFETKILGDEIIRERKLAYDWYQTLTPPRVMTSEGEVVTGEYKMDNLPDGAIPGLAVSRGVVEGRARIITKMEDAALAPGDILVTTFTDPSFTPLFVSVKGLVTEVGGLMTHGAVIAREYGLPAVVGVDGATSQIKDGQMIRVNGTKGYIEIL